jgi:sugar lactone lactonase YvrE
VDGDGRIFALNGGVLRRLTWNGTSYSETEMTVPDLDYGLGVGGDGALYSLSAGINWGGIKPPTTGSLLRIDPDSGASDTYATIEIKGGFFRGFCWDSDGNGWIALRDSRNGISYVIPLEGGDTIDDRSARNRIAEAGPGSLRNITAGTAGELYALAWDDPDTVYRIEPGSGGGGGGKGGGGKGKRK